LNIYNEAYEKLKAYVKEFKIYAS